MTNIRFEVTDFWKIDNLEIQVITGIQEKLDTTFLMFFRPCIIV